jgi:hypothetical protein
MEGAAMASTALFDGSGRRVGFTETRSNGNIVAYSPAGVPLGYYCATAKYTFEWLGRRVGSGNQIGMLFR